MRLLLTATLLCLSTLHADAALVPVVFEGVLSSVDEGFPTPLAEDETIRGVYLLDTETYFHGLGSLLGGYQIHNVPALVVAGSSGWIIGGNGQATAVGHQPLSSRIPGGLNNSVAFTPTFVVTAGSLPQDNSPVLEALSARPPRTSSSSLLFHSDFDDLHTYGLFFDAIELAGEVSHFDFTIPVPSAPITLSFGKLGSIDENLLPPDLTAGAVAALTLRLSDGNGQDRIAFFNVTSLAVVPEPTALALAAMLVSILCQRRRWF